MCLRGCQILTGWPSLTTILASPYCRSFLKNNKRRSSAAVTAIIFSTRRLDDGLGKLLIIIAPRILSNTYPGVASDTRPTPTAVLYCRIASAAYHGAVFGKSKNERHWAVGAGTSAFSFLDELAWRYSYFHSPPNSLLYLLYLHQGLRSLCPGLSPQITGQNSFHKFNLLLFHALG